MDVMKIYDRLPVWGQNLACTLEGVRVNKRKHGKRVQNKIPEYLERGDWTYAQLSTYRDAQLSKMIEHCYRHVPYYHKLFKELGIDYHNIKTLDDLKALPILTKATVKDNFEDFLADNVNHSELMKVHTSGTSGSAFQFYYTKDAYAAQWADKTRYDRSLGLTGKEWAAYFGGRPIVPRKQTEPPFYRVNYAMREVMFSVYHLSQENYRNYIEGLESRKMEVWHGYPSSFLPIAQYMLDHHIKLSYVPKVIQLTSENVTTAEIDKMEKAFGVRPLMGYAQTEQVANFWQYPDGKYHIMEDLSAVELLPAGEENLYFVVGTTLTNYAMPFLRYDTRDLVAFEETAEGRFVTSVDGRAEDYIKLSNGDTIRGSVSFIFSDQPNVTEAQVVQKSLNLVEIHVVKAENYDSEDEKRLYQSIENCFNHLIDTKVVYVDHIPKTKNGKMKFIVSEI